MIFRNTIYVFCTQVKFDLFSCILSFFTAFANNLYTIFLLINLQFTCSLHKKQHQNMEISSKENLLSHDVVVIHWIASSHKNRMNTRVIAFGAYT